MANDLVRPEQFFLNRFGMNESGLERILGNALERKADYADLFFEYRSAEGLALEESMVNHTSKAVSHGVGVRVCAEDRTGYAYSDEVTFDRMRIAAEAARAIADSRADPHPAVQVGGPVTRHQLYELESTPLDVPIEDRAKLLRQIDELARAYDPRVRNVMASFSAERKIVMIVNSEGRVAADVQPLCRLNVTVIAEDEKAVRSAVSVVVAGSSGAIFSIRIDGSIIPKKRPARRSSTLTRSTHPRAKWWLCLAVAGLGFCCTRRSATASRATSIARASRLSPAGLGNR